MSSVRARGGDGGGASARPSRSPAASGGARVTTASTAAPSSTGRPTSSSSSGAATTTTTSRLARSNSPDASAGQQPGLRGLVQQRLLNDVFQSASDKCSGWKVLVVDDHAMRVISAAVGMYDIMERKITLVESLDKKRAPFQDMGAIYLVEPTPESVRKIVADFSGPKPLYGSSVFLFFLGRLSDRLLDEIKRCKALLKRVKALSEVNIDFLAKEERAFNLDLKDSFTSFYLRKSMTPIELKIAEKLVTVCATLNEYPHIRFRQSSAICTSLANVFHLKMDEFVAQNPAWWYHGGSTSKSQQAARRERGSLLLLDRADDCLTPLMHDFTYQSMVHDLLPMDGDRITFQAEQADDPTKTEAKDVLLDEKDSIWVELRGKHIAAVIETLSERIREIMNSSTASTLTKKAGSAGGNMSLSEMASALKALPEYREVLSKLSQHMHLAHQCMDKFTKDKLMELSEFEQTLATGKDEDGRTPKLSDIIDTAERLLMDMKDTTSKLRLLLILTVSQGGLRQQDRRRLVNVAELSRQDMRTLNGLEILGLSTLASSDKKNLISLLKFSRDSGAEDEGEYAASRYNPPLKTILEELVSNSLGIEDYPSVLPMPEMGPTASSGGSSGGAGAASARGGAARSARSSRRGEAASARRTTGASSRWAKSSGLENKRGTGPVSFSGGRSIVFFLGGMSYQELKVTRDVMMNESREIVIGSTTFLSPSEFVSDLIKLGQEDE